MASFKKGITYLVQHLVASSLHLTTTNVVHGYAIYAVVFEHFHSCTANMLISLIVVTMTAYVFSRIDFVENVIL